MVWAMAGVVMLSAAFAPVPPSMVLVIDAGHGGKDPGNLGTGRYRSTEKSVTLDVALRLRDYITERFPDVKIVMTRTDDSFPTLKDRVTVANNSEADLFISIHCDAFTSSSALGSSTFVMGMHKSEESMRVAMQENASRFQEEDYERRYEGFNPNDPDTYIALALRQKVFLDQSLELGSLIQNQFASRVGRKDRGVRQAGFYVISYTQMPSVLVELGFLSNPGEEDFLNSERGKDLMASGILRAFRVYKELHHPKTSPIPSDLSPSITLTTSLVSPTYRVQILAAATQLTKDDPRFSGLAPVVEYLRSGLYKYAVGSAASMEEANVLKTRLQSGLFPDAFVITFEGQTLSEQGVSTVKAN